ncbi:LysE family translocator [Methylobacterium sp. Leaf100]|uniref:LysE family translocator n=1 Tax=Methylobacterium sp. Leaf100 TaxID=1736252 RepID=UPI0006FAAC42|nr:LysE family translocator [Methylobacterium sp. Leaf100]KQP28897.1 lysine transporter LysE [Methylobacterium sp. Leaf100]
MSIANLLLFAGIYAVAVASPGPGIAALVARVLARGPVGIGAFIAGFVVGDLVWFGVAAAGMALLARSLAVAFVVLKYAGAVYLAVLAWKAWTAPLEPIETERVDADGRIRLFFCGLVLTLGNPKVILFFLALLPGVVDLDRLTLLGFAEIGATIVVVLSAVLCAYAGAADRARRVFTSIRARRAIDRSAGTVMAGAAVAIATR